MDLIVRNARLRDRKEPVDIGIHKGKIVAIDKEIKNDSKKEIDAGGKLTIPPFIDPHIHLDKTLINEIVRPNESGTLTEAIEIIWDKKATYTIEDIAERARKIIRQALIKGTTRLRTHVDVDTIGGLLPVKGLLKVKKEYVDLVDLQIVAFPQEGILKDPGCAELMWKAMEMGCDVVGGMPANENSPEDSLAHVKLVFDIAEKYDADIDMHVDETDDPFHRTLEMTADETIKRGWQGRVTAGHTCALAAYDQRYADYVMDKVKKAGIHMITNPVTNLMLQGRLDKQPVRRGITRVKELLQRKVNMAYGQDCIKDTFYPFGRADMLEVGLIVCHAAHMSMNDEIKTVFNMPLENSAKILRIDDYGIEIGNTADLVILDTDNEIDAIRTQAERLFVIRKGKIIASTIRKTITNF